MSCPFKFKDKGYTDEQIGTETHRLDNGSYSLPKYKSFKFFACRLISNDCYNKCVGEEICPIVKK